MSSSSNNSHLESYPASELDSNHDFTSALSSPNPQKEKTINITIQELDNVKRFLLNLNYYE